MGKIDFKIESILGGQSPMYHGAGEGQFNTSVAIDPEESLSAKPSGHILPVGYADFTTSVPSGAPMWLVTNPVNENIYVYGDDGEFYSYSNVFGSETSIGTPTSGAGNGSAYYNNYIYLATPTDVSRYGPLNSSPAIVNTYWTAAATAGLGLTALVNTTYPGTNSVNYPNHAMHVHTDNALYFCDFDSTSTTAATRGKGLIHKIKTMYGTAGAITNDGSATDGSAYNVLDLPAGYRPFDIESYGTDLAIVASVVGSSTAIMQGESALFLWDTFADTFYRQIPVPVAFLSSIKNVNGTLFLWGGSVDRGYVLFRYVGGYELDVVWESLDGDPPFAGAVDRYGDRVVWGSNVSDPITGGVIMSHGYQNKKLGIGAVHNIGIMDSTQTLPTVSSLKFVQQAQATKRVIAGWRAQSNEFGISKVSSGATKNSVFRSEVFTVNKKFAISDIRIPLTGPVDANVTITVKIYFDDAVASKTLQTINNTNYPGAYSVTYKDEEIEQAATTPLFGNNNFFLEFAFTGTSAIGVALPVEITAQTYDE
jgi:hypothetical protein